MSRSDLEELIRKELDDVVRVHHYGDAIVVARKNRGNISMELTNDTLEKILDSGLFVKEVLADSSEEPVDR